MNEIELQKHLVKEAFGKSALPNYGLVDGNPHESALQIRNCVWKAAGYLQNEDCPKGHGHNQRFQVRSKKQALVLLYKLWSGFTKNLRYMMTSKGVQKVKISKIGYFQRAETQPVEKG